MSGRSESYAAVGNAENNDFICSMIMSLLKVSFLDCGKKKMLKSIFGLPYADGISIFLSYNLKNNFTLL